MKTQSPCIFVCRLAEDDETCVGCFRTAAEIGAWGTASEGERGEIVARADARRRAQAETG